MINMLTTPQTQTIDENEMNKYSQLDSSPREVLNMTKQSQSSGNGLTKYINPINRSSEGDISSIDLSKRSGKTKKFDHRTQKSPMERSGSVKHYLDEHDLALLTSLEVEQVVKKLLG
jgi:hypothetical protein